MKTACSEHAQACMTTSGCSTNMISFALQIINVRTGDDKQQLYEIHTTSTTTLRVPRDDRIHEPFEIHDDPKTFLVVDIDEIGHEVMGDAILPRPNASDGRIRWRSGTVDDRGRVILDLGGVVIFHRWNNLSISSAIEQDS